MYPDPCSSKRSKTGGKIIRRFYNSNNYIINIKNPQTRPLNISYKDGTFNISLNPKYCSHNTTKGKSDRRLFDTEVKNPLRIKVLN